jgi:hypothetical protein
VGCLFAGKNTFENEELRETLRPVVNEVSQHFRTLRDRTPNVNRVLKFMKLRWNVQAGEGGGGTGSRRGDGAHRILLAQNLVKWRDYLWVMLKFGFCYQRIT